MEALNLVSIGSIEEYRVVNGSQLRSLGKQPISPWSYPCRGFAGAGLRETTQVVLPDVPPVRKYALGLRSIWKELGVAKATLPAIWVEDPLVGERDTLDRVILDDLEGFRSQLHPEVSRFLITPHANTPELSEWRGRLRSYGVKTVVVMAPKPYDYPNISDRSGFADFAQNQLPIPYSRVTVDRAQLVKAYEDVAAVSGNKLVWAKLAASGGGYGVNRVNNVAEVEALYERFSSLGVLKLYGQEIPWEMQAHVGNIVALCSWQYHGNKVTTPGGFSLQYFDFNNPNTWIGNGYNINPEGVPKEALDSMVRDLELRTMAALKTELGSNHNHMGGFDFAITREEDYGAVLLEHNGARMSDSVMQVEAARALGINRRDPFMAIKLGPAHCAITDVWQLLKKKGLSLSSESKKGVIPFVWLDDKKMGYASVLISASNSEQLRRLHDLSQEAMRAEGMIN